MSDESKGGIVRVKKESRYFVASNQPFNDPRLSFGARGLMGYLLSKPDNWQIRNYDLYRKSPDGRSKVQGYLAELKKFGYLTRFPISKGKSGINWVSEVYESPEDNPHLSSYRFSNDENSNDEFSSFEKVPPITITKSPTTKPLNTDAQHGAAEFLGWIQEPSFSKITALDH